MTWAHAPLVGWGAFLVAALAASMAGIGVQLGFAAAAVAVLGLPHGASDLAVVSPAWRGSFLTGYGAVVGAVLAVWVIAPTIGLCLLLTSSAAHFALDDPGLRGRIAAWTTGICLVAAPAVIHRDALTVLFADITGDAAVARAIAMPLQAIGIVALSIAAAAVMRDDRHPAAERIGTLLVLAAVVMLPPLVGFATGFVLLHARGQTEARRRALGCATTMAYMRRIAPVMAGAAIVLAGIAATFAGHPHASTVTLFAAIAALATPHMLVTPLALRAGRGAGRDWAATMRPA